MNQLKVNITEFRIYGDHPPALEKPEKERSWSQIPPHVIVKKKETQAFAKALIDTWGNLGEMIEELPKPKFDKQISGSLRGTTESLPVGIHKKESHLAQTIFNNRLEIPDFHGSFTGTMKRFEAKYYLKKSLTKQNIQLLLN
jgi:hypothetical protein